MAITYERFMELVPEDTKHFIKVLLPYLERYKNEKYIQITESTSALTREGKAFFILVSCLNEDSKYSAFLKQNGLFFEKHFYTNKYLINLEKEFNDWSFLFLIFDDESKYKALTPMSLLSFLMINRDFTSRLGGVEPKIKEKVYNFRIKEYQEQEIELEKSIYQDLPVTCISYLETATKIRSLLLEKVSNSSYRNEFLKNTEEDLTSLSMLLALYYYQDVNMDEEDIKEQDIIIEMLKEQHIELANIWKSLEIDEISKWKIEDTRKNVFAIEHYYQTYYQNKELTVSKMFKTLLRREDTQSVAVEKILTSLGCNAKLLDFSESKIKEKEEEIKRNKDNRLVKEFYEELPKETIKFLEFATKTYTLVLKKMEQGIHNKEILVQEDDVDTLALYIANCYYNGKINEFYIDYGVTLEKVLKLIGIELEKEEIENTKLNQKILIDRFKRFIDEGENENRKMSNVNIENISYNLCNRTFNKSMIMENIFFEITGRQILKSDFTSIIKKHLKEKERTRIQKLSEKLFKDMPIEAIDFLEDVSRIHITLKNSKSDWNNKDLNVVSLLLGCLLSKNDKLVNFYKEFGFSLTEVCLFFNIDSKILQERKELNIDLLKEEYAPFIFGGENKNRKRCELTIFNISKNIFSKELNNSVVISRLLGNIKKTYEDFSNIDESYDNYLKRLEEEQKNRQAKDILDKSEDCKTYIINTVKLHSRLLKELEKGTYNKELFQKEDIKLISLFLSLFLVKNNIKDILEQKNITVEGIIEYLQISKTIIGNLEDESLDKKLLLEEYKEYFKCNKASIDELTEKVFDKQLNNSEPLEKVIKYFGLSYKILKIAIETDKPYESLLTVDERITWLNNETVDSINFNNMESILTFGMNLTTHSKYIDEKLPDLILNDGNENSIKTINSLLEKIHKTKNAMETKKNFFQKIFALGQEEKPFVLKEETVKELQDMIKQNIETLSQELLKYDEIRKYLNVYRKKNNEYLEQITITKEEIKNKLQVLNPENEEDFSDFLTASSILRIMEDKENRFITSNHLRKQELVKVNQMIVQHFITINALEMARDDLIPLIIAELTLIDGRNTENQALSISKNVINLFQALLTRNLDDAYINMENLKNSTIPEEVFRLLNYDVEKYINEIKQMELLNSMKEQKGIKLNINPLQLDSVNQDKAYEKRLQL